MLLLLRIVGIGLKIVFYFGFSYFNLFLCENVYFLMSFCFIVYMKIKINGEKNVLKSRYFYMKMDKCG